MPSSMTSYTKKMAWHEKNIFVKGSSDNAEKLQHAQSFLTTEFKYLERQLE